MKKILSIIFISILCSCSSTKNVSSTALYEILLSNPTGGATIKFYEILSEPKEIQMLLGDDLLKKKIKKSDIDSSNFLIINAGPTKESYNRANLYKVIETKENIEVYIKDNQKNVEVDLSDELINYPYSVIKINSKKPIVIK
jgi:predicted P-loop ATPase/GTPase